MLRNRGTGGPLVHNRFATDGDGWCAELDSWIAKSPSGGIFTIPSVDTDPK